MTPSGQSNSPQRGSADWWDLMLEQQAGVDRQALNELRAIRRLLEGLAHALESELSDVTKAARRRVAELE